MYRRILLALDAEHLAQAAVPIVGALARASAGEVLVVNVGDVEHEPRTRYEAAQLVEQVVERLRAVGVDANGEVRAAAGGGVADAIADSASRFEADLVTVGSHGRSDLGGLLLGSVGHQVAALISGPVLVVHKGGPGASGSFRAGRVKRLVLAVDAGPASEAAIEAALVTALAHDSAVTVVSSETALETEAVVWRRLDAAVERMPAGRAAASRLVDGEPAERIARTAEECDADLIVIGSERLTDLEALLFGDVTHQLIRRTTRPVLLAERSIQSAPSPRS